MTAGIPVLKTNSRIWQVLGGALYRARPLLAITLRELFQNSRDACRGIDRAPDIVLTLETDDFRQGILTCQDNGIGMSEETLLSRFLVLGESDKTAGSTGGWGYRQERHRRRRVPVEALDE
jgi:DNA topoisomerase VI subunit B